MNGERRNQSPHTPPVGIPLWVIPSCLVCGQSSHFFQILVRSVESAVLSISLQVFIEQHSCNILNT